MKCSACAVTLPEHGIGYYDDAGKPLCASCWWKASSA